MQNSWFKKKSEATSTAWIIPKRLASNPEGIMPYRVCNTYVYTLFPTQKIFKEIQNGIPRGILYFLVMIVQYVQSNFKGKFLLLLVFRFIHFKVSEK